MLTFVLYHLHVAISLALFDVLLVSIFLYCFSPLRQSYQMCKYVLPVLLLCLTLCRALVFLFTGGLMSGSLSGCLR